MAKAFDLTDKLLKGGLAKQLKAWRNVGWSYQAIASFLTDETGVQHSRETVRRWCGELGVEKAKAS